MQLSIRRVLPVLHSTRFWLGVSISVICFVLVFRGVQYEKLGSALRTANYLWLLPAIGLLASSMVVRAIRWRTLFPPDPELRFAPFFHVLNIGYLANNVLPARLGDIIRAGLLSKWAPVSVSQTLSTVVVERVMDGLFLVLMLAVILPFVPLPDWVARTGLIAGGVMLMASIALVVLSTQRGRSIRWSQAVLSRIPGVEAQPWEERVGHLVDGLKVLRSPQTLARAGFWSAVVWILSAVAYYCIMKAFGLSLSVAAAMFVLVATTLVQIVPATPGYVGVFDYTGVLALSAFGVDRNLAVSCVIVMHAVSYATFSVMGLISLMQESLSFSAVIGEQSSVSSNQ